MGIAQKGFLLKFCSLIYAFNSFSGYCWKVFFLKLELIWSGAEPPFFFNCLRLFLDALGLHCYARAFPHCGEWGSSLAAVHRLLVKAASFGAEHRL